MKRYNNDRILVISDTHFPFHHKDVFKFLKILRDTLEPDRIVHLGDLTDSYCFSSYSKSLKADNPPTEVKQIRQCSEELGEIFPNMAIMQSNHDDRLYRKARTAGIPRDLVLKYQDFVGAPEGWKWYPDLTLTVNSTRQKIYFAHHKSGSALNVARHVGMPVVLGHFHSRSGVQYSRVPSGVLWGADCGSLISDSGHAFTYNSSSTIRPMRSVVFIENGFPSVIPFITKGKNNRWDGSIRVRT